MLLPVFFAVFLTMYEASDNAKGKFLPLFERNGGAKTGIFLALLSILIKKGD